MRGRTLFHLFTVLFCAATAAVGFAEEAPDAAAPSTRPEICLDDLRGHMEVLASDAMRGRESLSEEATRASAYIAAQFERFGLEPKGTDGFFQPYAIRQPRLGEDNALEVRVGDTTTAYTVEKDWNPFSVSKPATVSGPVVVAGYGISAPGRGYDDFAGIDVKGKIVLVLRKNPGWQEQRHASFAAKLSAAVKAGAAGLLLVNNPATVKEAGRDRIGHWSAGLGRPAGSGSIPYAFVSQEIATQMLASVDITLDDLETHLRSQGPASRELPGVEVTLTTSLTTTTQENTRNVVGFLPGTDPEVAHEVLVLGAHYDHVGLGLYGSTGGAQASGLIHNGADDNGSGTVGLLELAERFAAPTGRPARSLLFIAFSGEERGLLGSAHFVNDPTVPLADIVGMINMDMIGRCREGQIQIGGVGTAKGLQQLVAKHNERAGLRIDWDPQGTAPSDSTSFFRKGLPVLFFFTGLHEDYHRPTDDIERIAWPDLLRIVHMIEDVTRDIANREDRLEFTRPPAPPRPPVLGVQPSPEPNADGLAILRVTANGPAAKGGMRDGDVIVSLANTTVKDLRSLRRVLSKLKAGQSVKAIVLRGDARVPLMITLGARRR